MNTKTLTLALLLGAVPLAAPAADKISYTYVEAGYGMQTLEGGDIPAGPPGYTFTIDDTKANGFYFSGSAELGDSFHLFGGYKHGDDGDVEITGSNFLVAMVADGSPLPTSVEADFKQLDAGVGYHYALSDRADLVADISYVHTDVEFDDRSKDGDDYRVGLGVRGLLSDSLEAWIKGNYSDGDAYDGEISGTIGAKLKFNQTWGLVGQAEFGDKYSQCMVGIRASF
jgi:hypothetical protein